MGSKAKDIALGQFEPSLLLFYVLIALALPLRHADLVIVMLSWVFVVICFAHTGIFATSNDPTTLADVVCGRVGTFRNVDLLCAKNSFFDLGRGLIECAYGAGDPVAGVSSKVDRLG